MKSAYFKIVALIAIATSFVSVHPHIFTFKNHTDEAVQVGIRLWGIDEKFYNATVPAQKSGNVAEYAFRFVAGEGPYDMARKFGFCLETIQLNENGLVNVVPTYWMNKAKYTELMYKIKNKQPFMLARDFGITQGMMEKFCWSTTFDIVKDEEGALRIVVFMGILR